MKTNLNIEKKNVKKFAFNLRKNILEMALTAGANSSHFGGALSIVEVVASLFASVMNIDPTNPQSKNRDRFILSKGHGCLVYYAALSEIGFIKKEELKTFEKDNSNLLGHPVINRSLGIDFSNGSLGMGLSLGIGVALSLKKKDNNNNVYVIMGDGECNEGSVWEAAMAAPNFKLNNLCVIIDKNNFQQTGSSQEIMKNENLKDKWKSFSWDVEEVDGHNINEILSFFNKDNERLKPRVLIANTIKGKGFSFSENNNDWHHSVLSNSLYHQGLEELNKDLNDS